MKTHLNGSVETRSQAIARIEAEIKRLLDDLQQMKYGKESSKWENGFQIFLKTHVDRRN